MEFYIKVQDGKIEDIKFKTFGCGSAIATASMITELAKGKTVGEALKITRQDVADELDGLPPIKMHCSNLAADALKDAIKNYQEKQKPTPEKPAQAEPAGTITGKREFTDRGVYTDVTDLAVFKDKRTMVVEAGERSMEIALQLTKQTPRVVFVTRNKELPAGELNEKLASSNVKILYESEVLAIKGLNTVEKVLIHDLNEDEEYELYVDSIIVAQS
jgi:nitrogen fixation NifU-like protein